MTEAEWLATIKPPRLLGLLFSASDRKRRLFAVACARRVAHLVRATSALAALEFAEQMADRGAAGRRGRLAVEKAGLAACHTLWNQDQAHFNAKELLAHLAESNATHAAVLCASAEANRATDSITSASLAAAYTSCKTPRTPTPFPRDRQKHIDAEEQIQADLLRDIVGNPFRPVTFAPAWHTTTTVALAERMYQLQDFTTLPILADALQDAGCDDEQVLHHCHNAGPHVRGCWVLDRLLGKS